MCWNPAGKCGPTVSSGTVGNGTPASPYMYIYIYIYYTIRFPMVFVL